MVDLTRQALSKLANDAYLKAVTAFLLRDIKALDIHCQKFIQLIKDIEELLASDDNFLLGTWLDSAKRLASNPMEMRQVRKDVLFFLVLNANFSAIYFFYMHNLYTIPL